MQQSYSRKNEVDKTQKDNWFLENERYSWGFHSTSTEPENYTKVMSRETMYSVKQTEITPKLS